MDKHQLLHNIISAGECPISWQSLSGADVLRTCTKCGACILNEAMVETAEFDQALAMISAKDNTSFYRRNDGKLMLRPCGAKPSYRFAAHFIGWTGAAAALVVLLRHIFSLQVVLPPDQLMIALYAWNVLGVIFLARNMLNGSRQRLICFLFLTPLCVTLVLCFASLAMHIYWLIMFTHK